MDDATFINAVWTASSITTISLSCIQLGTGSKLILTNAVGRGDASPLDWDGIIDSLELDAIEGSTDGIIVGVIEGSSDGRKLGPDVSCELGVKEG